MKLRDHPQMSYRGTATWPPLWRCISTREKKVAKGEIGVLHSVRGWGNEIVLRIEHDAEIFETSLRFENKKFCSSVYDLLRVLHGYPIDFVAGRDVGNTGGRRSASRGRLGERNPRFKGVQGALRR
jgi:hypothetical protein